MSTKETKEKNNSAFANILEAHDDIRLPQVGDLIDCKVVAVGKNEVVLDYNGILSGVVRGKEVQDEGGVNVDYKLDDLVSATVLDLDNEKGYMELSFRYASHQKAWEDLEKIMKEESIVEAKVIDANKGGLMVKVGNIVGFLPVSQLTTKYYPRVEGGDKSKILSHLKSFIGKAFKTVVIDVDEKESKLIVSQKSAWAEEQKKTLEEYGMGKVIEGKITGVADFGAFVEFGDNLEGLVHISELAWQRIDNPNDVIKVGDKVKAEIISVDDGRISLSMKKLISDPWKDIEKKYKIGGKVKGKVLKINPFGAFIELDKDIHGLAHISELSDHIINSPEDVVVIGETYDFTIINLESKDHRLGLSLKASKIKKEKSEKEVEAHEESTKEDIKDSALEEVENDDKKEQKKKSSKNKE
ncbi:MAG: S1 RNA-binding domain-containing protein [Patescibacteria group bacterium]|nr:S1 RNA-binding domain-containing protein [Patescibacteria group bacterium]MDD4303901.1 S1 RNA-binding domain-containing protein [Patescibacteria group bacterium]MDD4695112.1 S1 RNA-binding domain-containing protein [Patescibacteria group bacterium]